jgi:quercetin dioxygenase-like cupin family protein
MVVVTGAATDGSALRRPREGLSMIIRGQAAPIVQAGTGVTRQVLGHDPELMMVRVTFEQGAVGRVHSHPHRQVTFVERGQFDFEVDAVTTRLLPGDSVFVPPGAPHGTVAIEAGSLVDVFAPARIDFL